MSFFSSKRDRAFPPSFRESKGIEAQQGIDLSSHDEKKVTNESRVRVKCTFAPPSIPTPSTRRPSPRSGGGARVWKQNAIHGILRRRCVNSLEDCGVRIVHRSSGTIPRTLETERAGARVSLTEAARWREREREREENRIERERGRERGGRCRGALQVLASNPRPFQTSNYRK